MLDGRHPKCRMVDLYFMLLSSTFQYLFLPSDIQLRFQPSAFLSRLQNEPFCMLYMTMYLKLLGNAMYLCIFKLPVLKIFLLQQTYQPHTFFSTTATADINSPFLCENQHLAQKMDLLSQIPKHKKEASYIKLLSSQEMRGKW